MGEQRYEECLNEIKERLKLSFEILEDEAKIKVKELDMEINLYSQNYTNPPVPKGYKHIEGEWDTGWVIEREFDASQFVWIPVGFLKPNGTLNGKQFVEKFGRRNFLENPSIMYLEDFWSGKFKERNPVVFKQLCSVKKYGGFYVSRFLVSKKRIYVDSKCNLYAQSKKGEESWPVDSSLLKAVEKFENGDSVESHIIYGAEFDTILEWMIESKAISLDILKGGKISKETGKIYNTGSSKTIKLNNVYDFGNMDEFTGEIADKDYCDIECIRPANGLTDRKFVDLYGIHESLGTRICLYLK